MTIEAGELRLDSLPHGRPLFLITRTGRRVPNEIYAKTLELAAAPWIMAIARDISGQRERERRLRCQHEHLRTIAEIRSTTWGIRSTWPGAGSIWSGTRSTTNISRRLPNPP
jgi:hypothetical protein